MKILFFSRLFYPHIGGVEKHVLQISKILIQRGHSVTVITEQYDRELKTYEEFENIKIYRIPMEKSEKSKKFIVWKWLFHHKILIEKSDIVHSHDVFYWYFPFRVIYPFKNVYVTFHGYEGNKIPDKKSVFMHKMAEVLSRGNMCIGDFLTKWYGTKATVISYGATEIPNIKLLKKNFSKLIKIVFIGRLEYETGFLNYIKAIKHLKDKKYRIEFVVLGSGKLEDKAKEYAKKHNLQVKFMGFVKDTLAEIANCDVVFTSRYLGILEAFASRRPVIAQYNNIIKKDYLELSPFCKWIDIGYEPNDLTLCTEEVLLHYPSEKISMAYRWVKKHTWEKLTDDYLTLWRK